MPTHTLRPPFRADVVGSYLRPAELHQARKDAAQGRISPAQLKAVEDKTITELVSKQKQAGLRVITDGEFRRSWWHLDFMWGLNGVHKQQLSQGYRFADMETRAETAQISGRISGENHPFVEHFRFLLSLAGEDTVPRMTLPAPAQTFKEFCRPDNIATTNACYPDQQVLIRDLTAAYQTVIRELYAAGCRNLQLDDCTWGMMVDARYNNSGIAEDKQPGHSGCDCHPGQHTVISDDLKALTELLLSINNAALVGAPEDMVLTTHVCRGNYRSTWAASGGYQAVAEPLLGRENVSAYYLEFDTERAGDFSPLAYTSGDKKVVLGLISSKTGELEDKQAIINRIHEATRYLPLERLCLSTQCGFASTEEGNTLTEAQQWAKIALVTEIAREVWGD